METQASGFKLRGQRLGGPKAISCQFAKGVNSVHSFDRLYQLTSMIKPEGKAAVVWKFREDR
jgi:hypothetical protein